MMTTTIRLASDDYEATHDGKNNEDDDDDD